jgi:glycerophosphoryl diester phosphodiesterase
MAILSSHKARRGACQILAGLALIGGMGLSAAPVRGAEFHDFFLNLDGLVSYWGMSETSGNTVADLIKNDPVDGDNPGTFTLGGGATLGVEGPSISHGFAGLGESNTAIDFAGVAGQRLDMDPTGYTGPNGLVSASLTAWFRLTAPSTLNVHHHLGGLQLEADGVNSRYGLALNNYPQASPTGPTSQRGGLRAFTRVGNAPDDLVTYATTYTSTQGSASFWDSQWHFAATTITPYGNQSRMVSLYVDGKLVDRAIAPASDDAGKTVGPDERISLRDALTFGEDAGDSSRLWVGQLDEIATFSRNLTAGEVGIAWQAARGITVNHAVLPTRGISAHRGASTTHPENTLAALREAVASGAHQVEFDVQLTADNQLVLMHDGTIDRTTNGTGRVRDYTLAQLKALDAGEWKNAGFAGEQIPTLEEALDVLPLNMLLNVEVKGVGGNDSATAQRVAQVLHEKGRLHQSFISGGVDTLAGVALYESQAGIEIKTNNLDRQGGNVPAYIATTIANGNEYIQLQSSSAFPSPAEIEALKDANVTINYYFSDNRNNIATLFNNGVDFVLTNDPVNIMGSAIDLDIVPLLPLYRGDFNADGRVDTRDFDPLFQALVDRAAFELANPGFDADIYGDFSLNGQFGWEDYEAFHNLVTGGNVLAGDYNLDGVVDDNDYLVWKAAYGQTTASLSLLPGDGNGDGVVDALDFTIWRNNYGTSVAQLGATPASVPEPSTLLAVVMAAAGTLAYLRTEHGRN